MSQTSCTLPALRGAPRVSVCPPVSPRSFISAARVRPGREPARASARSVAGAVAGQARAGHAGRAAQLVHRLPLGGGGRRGRHVPALRGRAARAGALPEPNLPYRTARRARGAAPFRGAQGLAPGAAPACLRMRCSPLFPASAARLRCMRWQTEHRGSTWLAKHVCSIA